MISPQPLAHISIVSSVCPLGQPAGRPTEPLVGSNFLAPKHANGGPAGRANPGALSPERALRAGSGPPAARAEVLYSDFQPAIAL